MVHRLGLPVTGAQLTHWYDVGLFVQDAVSVSVVLTAGEDALGDIEQNGVGLVGGGGVDEPPVRQSTSMPDFPLEPALLLATNA